MDEGFVGSYSSSPCGLNCKGTFECNPMKFYQPQSFQQMNVPPQSNNVKIIRRVVGLKEQQDSSVSNILNTSGSVAIEAPQTKFVKSSM